MRRSGKTTRKVDKAIQVLFTEGGIFIPSYTYLIKDNYDDYVKIDLALIIDPDWLNNHNAQENLKFLILRRLKTEHSYNNDIDSYFNVEGTVSKGWKITVKQQ